MLESKEKIAQYDESFKLVDKDASGTISLQELSAMMRLRFPQKKITNGEVSKILKEMDQDNDGVISFDEYVNVMDKVEGSEQDAFNSFVQSHVKLMDATEPLWRVLEQRQLDKEERQRQSGSGSIGTITATITVHHRTARTAAAMIIDGNTVQMIVLLLVVFDVIFVICELLLVYTPCGCVVDDTCQCQGYLLSDGHADDIHVGNDSETDGEHRFLSTMNHGVYDEDYVYDTHRQLGGGACAHHGLSDTQYEIEQIFHWGSVSILIIFATQIFMQMLVYGSLFFTKPFYVLDLVVVSVSLVFETALTAEGGFFVMILLWRALRVVHGLLTTAEIHQHATHTNSHDEGHASEHVKKLLPDATGPPATNCAEVDKIAPTTAVSQKMTLQPLEEAAKQSGDDVLRTVVPSAPPVLVPAAIDPQAEEAAWDHSS